MLSDDVPAPQNPNEYYPDQLILYGIKLNQDVAAVFPLIPGKSINITVNKKADDQPLGQDQIVIAAIYGYAFEGQCYRLNKPRIYIFDSQRDIKASGCGFDIHEDYRMWRIRSRTIIMEVELSFDSAESLILEANLPGNRSPNTYGNSMQLAHRNGKLGRSGTSS